MEESNELKKQLEDKLVKYHKLQGDFQTNVSNKVKLFQEYIKKFEVTIKFLCENNVLFCSPKNDYYSSLGPIIGLNDDKLYVYNYQKKHIEEMNIYNNNTTVISQYEFFSNHDFSDAIDGVKYVTEIEDLAIDETSKLVKKQEEDLQKYKLD